MRPAEALVPVALGALVGLVVSAEPRLAVVGAVGIGAAFAGLAHPPLLVLGMWMGMLFDKLGTTGASLGGFPVTAAKLAVLGSAGLWCAHALLRGARLARWHPVLSAMVAMLVTTAFCVAWSASLERGRFDLAGLGMMTLLVALVYAILAESDLAPLYRRMAVVFVFVLVVSVRAPVGVGEASRATGTFGDPNEWATIVLLLTPVLLGGLAGDEGRLARALRLALVLLAPLALLRSGSRAALVVGALVLPACALVCRRRRDEMALAAGLGILAAPLVIDLDAALSRFRLLLDGAGAGGRPEDPSLSERAELLRQGLDLFRNNWLLGAGPGRFAVATGFVTTEGTLRPAHNTWLQIAGEQGVVGLTVTGVFVAVVALTLGNGARAARGPAHRERVLGVTLGLGALGLMAFTLGLFLFSMAWLVLGVGLAVVRQATVPGPDERRA